MKKTYHKKIILLLSCIFVSLVVSPIISASLKENLNISFDLRASQSTSSTTTPPSLSWNYSWDGGATDWGMDLILDSSNNAYIGGYTNSYTVGGSDICMVKFNSLGIKQSNISWGGGSDDQGHGIALDSSGNVYVGGYTESFGASWGDVCVVKFSSNGLFLDNFSWDNSSAEKGYGLALDSDGNMYVVGQFWYNSEDYVGVVKLDSDGNEVWSARWGGVNDDWGKGIALDSLNNVYVTGYTGNYGAGNYDLCLVKFNSSGGKEWNYTWGGSGADRGEDIILDQSGNIFILGASGSFEASETINLCVVKFNSDGVKQWNSSSCEYKEHAVCGWRGFSWTE